MEWFGYTSSRGKQEFTVYMNEGEIYQIEEWVKKYPNIETGGDLFGAWIDDRKAVVQFVLGPGQNCHRTGVSFYQDIDYLRDAGGYLTQKHGLCNIGQWHSHHRLGLTRPSGGDENTVWGNMPSLGLNRYIVFIATITGVSRSYNYDDYGNSYTSSHNHKDKLNVNINPYLFEIKDGHRNGVLHGSIQEMKRNSPFRLDKAIQDTVKVGAESINKVKIFTKRPHENENENEDNPPKIMKPEEMSPVENFDNRDTILVDNVLPEEPSEQPNTQQDGNGSNVQAEDDSKETIRLATPRPHEEECKEKQTNIIDVVRGQEQSNIDVKNEHEQDNSQHYSAGGTIGNKDQVETGDTILVGDVPRDEHSEQSNIPQGDSTENDLPAEDPNEKSNHIKTTPKLPEGDEKATENDQDSGTENDQDSSQMNSAGENFQNEQDIVKTDGDTIKYPHAIEDDDPNGTQVEGMEVDNEDLSSKSGATNAGEETVQNDPGLKGFGNLSKGEENIEDQDQDATLKALKREDDPNGTQVKSMEDSKETIMFSTPTPHEEECKEKQTNIIDVGRGQEQSTIDVKNKHEQDNSHHHSVGGKIGNKDQVEAGDTILVGDVPRDEHSEQSNIPQGDSTDNDLPAEDDLNEKSNHIKTTPKLHEGDEKATENDQDSGTENDQDSLQMNSAGENFQNEQDIVKTDGDTIKIPHAIEDDDPNGTQVEGMEVDNEDLSSKSGATNAGEETVQNDPGLIGFGNLGKGEENTQDQDATLEALKREDDPNGTQVESMEDSKETIMFSTPTPHEEECKEKQTNILDEERGQEQSNIDVKNEREQDNSQHYSAGEKIGNNDDDKDQVEAGDTILVGDVPLDKQSGQSNIQQGDNADNDLPAEDDPTEKSNHTTPIFYEGNDNAKQTEIMDMDNGQLSTSKNTQDQDPNGTQDESMKDDKNLSSKSGATDVEKEPTLEDFGNIDGKDIEDQVDDRSGTKVEIMEVENEHLSSNSVATNVDQKHFVKDQTLEEFDNLGKKKNATEHQSHNTKPSALKQEGDPDGTKVERMEVDNECLPSKSGATRVDQHTLETDPAGNGDDEGRQLKTVTPLPSSTEKENAYVKKEEGNSKENKGSMEIQEISGVTEETEYTKVTSASLLQDGKKQDTDNVVIVSGQQIAKTVKDGKSFESEIDYLSGPNKISEADKPNESERDSQHLLTSGKTGEPNQQPIEKPDNQKTALLKEAEHLIKSIGADDENVEEIPDSSNTNQKIEEPIKNIGKDLQAQSDNESKTTINGGTDNNNSEFLPASTDRNSDETETEDTQEDKLTVDSEETNSPSLAGIMPMKVEHSSILSKHNEKEYPRHESAINGPEDQNPLEIPPKIEASMPPQKVDGNEPIEMTIDDNDDKDPKPFTNDLKVSTKKQSVESDAESKNGELSKKNNSRKSRSISDPPQDNKEQELTSKVEMNVADTMTEADAKTHAFTAKETNERMDSKNDETKVESDEVIMHEEVPTFEGIDQGTGDGNKIINENQNKEESSVSEKGVGKNETVDVHITQKQQKEMEQIESLVSQDEAAAVSESDPQEPKGKMKVSFMRCFTWKKNKDKENKNGDNQKEKKVSGKEKEKMEKSKEKPESTEASKISASKDDDTMKNAASNKVKKRSKKSQKKTDAIEMLESIDGGAEDNGEQVANNTIENEEELQKKGKGKSKKSKKKNKGNKDSRLIESKDDDSKENTKVAKKEKKKKSKEEKQEKKPKVQEQGKKSKQKITSIETSL